MNGVLNIAIADDEPLARLRLQQLCEDLNADCPNQIVAQYEHGSALVNALPRWAQGRGASSPDACDIPDVLLLDINMPGLSGVELAAYLKQHAPALAVIFVTAEPQHALAAFEVAALDYVLKPVRTERLLAALRKVSAKTASNEAVKVPSSTDPLMLRVHDGAVGLSLPLSQVLYFKSDHKATTVRTLQGQYTSSQSLLELESWLAALTHDFVRVHRNALLRRSAAGEVHLGDETEVAVVGVPERLQVSRRMLPSLRGG
jgi:two-component system, LytTR family, response regulator AlgR